MQIAVLGSGNGGCAVAFDFSNHGHSVNLFDFEIFPDNIRKIDETGGIYADGELTGFAPIRYAGHSIEQALDDAEMIIAVGPAYSTLPFATACKPYLRKGQIVLICPGSCGGSLTFKQEAGLSIRDSEIVVAETSMLPYAVRLVEPGTIKVFLKLRGGLFVAAVPASNTNKVLESLSDVYPAMASAQTSSRPAYKMAIL